jgi:hypothetical protein
VDPVLGRLPNKVLLGTTGGRVSLDRMAASPHEIVELRELDDEGVVVVLEKRFRL